MHHKILLAGFGGQGVMFAGQLLAYTAMDQGYYVTWIPSYGPEMRGGTAYCQVVIGDTPIGAPVFNHAELALVFNRPSFDRFEPTVAPGGLLIYNSSMIDRTSARTDIVALPIPATQLAAELGDQRLTNMILLGALLTIRPVLTIQAAIQAMEAHMPTHRRDRLPMNVRALEQGAKAVSAARSVN